MLCAAIVNLVAAVMTRVPTRYEDPLHFGAIGYALAGTYGYAAITVEVAERL